MSKTSSEPEFEMDEFLQLVVPLHSKVSSLKEENSELKIKVDTLTEIKQDLENENENLKEEINSLRKMFTSLKTSENEGNDNQVLEQKCKKLERENSRLKTNKNLKEVELNELKKAVKIIEENKFLLQIAELLENLKEINNQASAKVVKLMKQVDDNKFDCDEELNMRIFEYDKCKENLQKRGITIQQRKFPTQVERFKKTRQANESRRKNAFKMAYDIDQSFKNKSEQIQKYIFQNIDNVKSLIERENRKLGELKKISFTNDFVSEKKQFEDLLNVANEETLFFINLLQISGTASTSTNVQPNEYNKEKPVDKDSRAFNNNLNSRQSTKMQKSKSFDNLINKNMYETKNENGNSIMLKYFPESSSDKNDLLEVKFFLMKQLNIKDVDDITISRLGHQRPNYVRPIVVTLSNQKVYNDILKQANQRHFYGGANILVHKYEKLFPNKNNAF